VVCACKPMAAAASKIPITRVFAERIVRSFPLRVFQLVDSGPSLQVREGCSSQPAW
jgi:hypothetical protein